MSKLFLSRLKELQGSDSVSAFARYLEMPQKTVDTYIKEQRKPSVEFVMRVCSKCHVSADWLLGLSDQRAPLIEAPRQNNVSKTFEMKEKFPSFVRPICRSVRQYYKDTTNGAEKQVRERTKKNDAERKADLHEAGERQAVQSGD